MAAAAPLDSRLADVALTLLEEEGEEFISKNQKFDIYEFIEG